MGYEGWDELEGGWGLGHKGGVGVDCYDHDHFFACFHMWIAGMCTFGEREVFERSLSRKCFSKLREPACMKTRQACKLIGIEKGGGIVQIYGV